jgi:hypothetical protein
MLGCQTPKIVANVESESAAQDNFLSIVMKSALYNRLRL